MVRAASFAVWLLSASKRVHTLGPQAQTVCLRRSFVQVSLQQIPGQAARCMSSSTKHFHLVKPSDPELKFLELSPGRRVCYTDVGDPHSEKGTVVAIHGTPGSVYDFRYIGAELERAGCRLIRLDLPGHGKTPLEAVGQHGDPADGQAIASLLDEVIDALNLKKPYLLSHSLGGQIAMICADRHFERYSGLMLLSPVPCHSAHRMIRPHWLIVKFSYLHNFIEKTPLKPVWRALLRQIWILWGFSRRITSSEVAHGQRRLLYVDFENQSERSRRLKQTRLPTLLAWSQDDPMIEHHLHHELSTSMPAGPRLVYPDGGHFINKFYAAELGSAMVEFMSLNAMRNEAAENQKDVKSASQ